MHLHDIYKTNIELIENYREQLSLVDKKTASEKICAFEKLLEISDIVNKMHPDIASMLPDYKGQFSDKDFLRTVFIKEFLSDKEREELFGAYDSSVLRELRDEEKSISSINNALSIMGMFGYNEDELENEDIVAIDVIKKL